jgi:hypothetical protein
MEWYDEVDSAKDQADNPQGLVLNGISGYLKTIS